MRCNVAFLLVALAVAGCTEPAKTSEPTASSTPSPTPSSDPEAGKVVVTPTAVPGTTLDASALTVSDNISTVQATMVPGSLAIETGAQLALAADQDNPCAGTGGFFDCQPNLLKRYIDTARMFVGITGDTVRQVAPTVLKDVVVPIDGTKACGNLSPPASTGLKKVDYCVTSATQFEVLLHTDAGAFLRLTVDGNVYDMVGDPSRSPEGDGRAGVFHSSITFDSATTFSVAVELAGQACNDGDVRSPGSLTMKISKTPTVWQGKSMLYHPRWLFGGTSVTCATVPTDDLGLAFYTDFVGDNTASTGAIYFMPPTVSSVDAIAAYPLSAFCTNFASQCMGGLSFGDPNVIADTYLNPFCVTGDTTSWGLPCASAVEAIATPTYSPATDWVTPAALKALALTVPESL